MTQKLYCYVDETGQDTKGDLFIVVAVITGKERDELITFLEGAERQSGGRNKQEMRKKDTRRQERYISLALTPHYFKHKVFYGVYNDTKEYTEATAYTIAQAIHQYCHEHHIRDYTARIIIDGLKGSEGWQISRMLGKLNVKREKVKGERDESSPMLRLAHAVTKLVRGSYEDRGDYKAVLKKLEQQQVIDELK